MQSLAGLYPTSREPLTRHHIDLMNILPIHLDGGRSPPLKSLPLKSPIRMYFVGSCQRIRCSFLSVKLHTEEICSATPMGMAKKCHCKQMITVSLKPTEFCYTRASAYVDPSNLLLAAENASLQVALSLVLLTFSQPLTETQQKS